MLDATCDRLSDGAIFGGLVWWAAFGAHNTALVVAALICLVTSQVISYIKARAEASGLRGDGGIIERPERLVIVLTGAGLSGLFGLPVLLDVAMWGLAAASLVTLAQRLHAVRTSPGAMDRMPSEPAAPSRRGCRVSTPTSGLPRFSGFRVPLGGQLSDLGYATGWRMVRAMPEFAARNMFDAGALYAARGGDRSSCVRTWAGCSECPPGRYRAAWSAPRWPPTRGTGVRRSGCPRWTTRW